MYCIGVNPNPETPKCMHAIPSYLFEKWVAELRWNVGSTPIKAATKVSGD